MMGKLYKNKNWLYQKYIMEKLSTYKIAKICGCSNGAIGNWLKNHNIKARTRSEAFTGELHPQYGKFGKDSPAYRPLEERLWGKVDKKDNISECWPWIGCRGRGGHGSIGSGNDNQMRHAHTVMYEVFYKDKVEKGEVVHHMCENPSCCNPFHLVKITKGKHSSLHHKGKWCGEKGSNAKLTWKKVREIRKEYTGKRGEQTRLAKKYGVAQQTISKIINNKIWKE